MVQALFIDLLERGAPKSQLELPYLYRALTRRCLNHIRDRKTRARLLERHHGAALPSGRTPLEGQLLDRDALVRLADRLDEVQLETLVYRHFDDMTQEEIAEVMETSRKTVGHRLDAIQELVREVLAS